MLSHYYNAMYRLQAILVSVIIYDNCAKSRMQKLFYKRKSKYNSSLCKFTTTKLMLNSLAFRFQYFNVSILVLISNGLNTQYNLNAQYEDLISILF